MHYMFNMGPRIRDGSGTSKTITFLTSKNMAPYPIKFLISTTTSINTLMKYGGTKSFKEVTPPPSSFDLPPSCLTDNEVVSLFDKLL